MRRKHELPRRLDGIDLQRKTCAAAQAGAEIGFPAEIDKVVGEDDSTWRLSEKKLRRSAAVGTAGEAAGGG